MSTERLLLSEKYKAFLRCNAPVEFLEGTTAAGKTTVGLFKFMLKVAESSKKLHIIAAKDTGTAEKNIINKDLGIIDDFGMLSEYNGNGTKDDKIPHILFHTSSGDKIVYVMGYGDKKKWQKALGGQYGCLYIDEINTADIEFVRESSMRCDYFMATLNPDDPNLDVYKEYINCSRPLPEWEQDTPQEIKEELKEEPKPGWVHWFFSFDDNAGLPEETATTFFGLYMLAFLVGRWIGTGLMVKFRPQDMLLVYSLMNILLCGVVMIWGGMVGLYAMLAISFFMSIMYPTQFSLALKGLGDQTKSGSAFLVMAIVGNACLPQLTAYFMHANEHIYYAAYCVPMICFIFCAYYGWKGYKVID